MEPFKYKDSSNSEKNNLHRYPHTHQQCEEESMQKTLFYINKVSEIKKELETYKNLCEDLMLLVDMFSTNNVDLILFQRVRDQYVKTLSRKI